MNTSHATADAEQTWREVITLLTAAADRGATEGLTTPAIFNTAWGADILAAAALELLPRDHDHLLNETHLDESTRWMNTAALLRAAEAATRRHPVEQYPPGASRIILGLCDLIFEVTT